MNVLGYDQRRTETHSGRAAARMPVISLAARSLTAKVVIMMGLLITAGGGIFWSLSIQNDRKNLMDNTVAFVASFAEVVKKGVRNDMLHFRRDDIQRTIESIGATEPVVTVRIINAQGVISHSSDRRDIGSRIQRDSAACAGCHQDSARPREAPPMDRRWDIHRDSDDARTLSYVTPIYNEPDCAAAACHAHLPHQRVLGILTTDFSLLPMDRKIRQQSVESSIYFLLLATVSGALLYLILWRLVLHPVRSLSDAMDHVALGDLSERVPAHSRDEIGRLADTFNAMTVELEVARLRMEQWTFSLETEVKKKTDEILKTQERLIQAEKMAALGRLTAEIAHEIRNPLTALGGFGRRLLRISSSPKEKEYVDIMLSEVHRLEKILRDILTYSRDAKIRLKRLPVTEMVKECILTYSAVCEEYAISVRTSYGAEFPVLIDIDQARQAVNNLISNAVDVMRDGGVLTVATTAEKVHGVTHVAIHISDTGPGISEDKLPLIYEPFYTTKEIGRGTGLGLAISRKIIEEHGGRITAKNRNGRGFTSSLYFPHLCDEDRDREQCWEFMGCGRDTGAELKCPAYPFFGRACWVVGGTYCDGKVQGTFAQKCADCMKCEFYRKVTAGEV